MSGLPPHDWHAPIIASIVGAYVRHRPDAVYVEIGVDRGYTLAYVASATGVRAEGCDVTLANLDASLGLRGPARTLPNVTLREVRSDEFWKLTLLRPDVVFIDGDHDAQQVGRDVLGALDHLAPDGTIIVHDTHPVEQRFADSHCGDGWKVMLDLPAHELQVFTLPLFPGLSFVGRPPAPPA